MATTALITTPGLNLYLVLRDDDHQVWNGTAFEAYNASNWATYDIAGTEQTGCGYYYFVTPTLAAGWYRFDYRSGASPAIADPNVSSGSAYYDGTRWHNEQVDGILANVVAILAKFTGITLVAKWLGLLTGKTADATTLAEVNATTAGAAFDNTTDSLEAIRDRTEDTFTQASNAATDAAAVKDLTKAGGDGDLAEIMERTSPTAIRADLGLASANLDDQLEALLTDGAIGDVVKTVDCVDTNGDPVIGALVYSSSDSLMRDIIRGPFISNSQGIATCLVPLGAQYFPWIVASGETFPNPSLVTVAE